MLEYIKIEGFKSIKTMELELKPINVLIGSNGSGKSNFIAFFRLVHAIFNRQLQRFVIEEKSDNLLYFGRKTTESLYGKMIFTEGKENNNAYLFKLNQTKEGGLFIQNEVSGLLIQREASGFNVLKDDDFKNYYGKLNIEESYIPESTSFRDQYLRKYLANIQIYHFNDTSATSMLRKECDLADNLYLKPDGRNLPAFLYYLKVEYPKTFRRLEKTIQQVAPYIDHLLLEPSRLNKKEIELRWVEKSDLQSSFSAYQFSDGTLRFIALSTVLMQPEPPAVIIIDEPELGMHPQSISKLAALIKSASAKTQIIISTQSVNLVDCFDPENIVAVDRSEDEKQSIFKRLDPESLKTWLEDYSLGDLWQRNIINSAQPFSK
ncbi:MAG: AAA family ATPase [Bacteroidota bacterium]|nr:AAA family ATPase [Bacteroidota bacterium]